MRIGTIVAVVIMLVATLVAARVLFVINSRNIPDKAGPDSNWQWGRSDPMRVIFFNREGSLRRFSQPILSVWLILVILLCQSGLFDVFFAIE